MTIKEWKDEYAKLEQIDREKAQHILQLVDSNKQLEQTNQELIGKNKTLQAMTSITKRLAKRVDALRFTVADYKHKMLLARRIAEQSDTTIAGLNKQIEELKSANAKFTTMLSEAQAAVFEARGKYDSMLTAFRLTLEKVHANAKLSN